MADLNAIAAFVAVADAGTFSGGAEIIGIPKGSISRKISILEESLGVRLFHRTTRKVTLTDIGRSFYERCKRGVDELSAATQLVDESTATPSGILRIAAPAAFGEGAFGDVVATYLARYPKTRVELLLSDEYVDLIEERIDLALRFGELQDSSLIARKLSSTHRILCASPKLLEVLGEPKKLEDLAEFPSIVHGATLGQTTWRMVNGKGTEFFARHKPRLAAQSISMASSAAALGIGVALLPERAAEEALQTGALTHILTGYTTPTQGLYAIYPSSKQLSLNVRTFMDLLSTSDLLAK
ncbi:HTH-type transcriptional regulator DmlR [Pseudovibrio sp. Ad5]|uniref:LysR family transcriptional regulator n=1 Tax=Pseudovibrio sp. Ad5 TaxID=989436 RepID=UPI0007AE3FD6|nr:LysR family transcriptional regulator [Pseudovibrio sp. Ad5]KZK92659.1 HTH-type transcriptional regulator DmlR [Pseudovibrio sp. Ad5]